MFYYRWSFFVPLRKFDIMAYKYYPYGHNHRGEWKKWAKYVSAKTGYNIQRLEGDETYEDQERLEGSL